MIWHPSTIRWSRDICESAREGSEMIYRTFGRTGLKVSAAGLGGGGFSRLGLAKGKSEAEVNAAFAKQWRRERRPVLTS